MLRDDENEEFQGLFCLSKGRLHVNNKRAKHET
jgi:hypothetical protein